MLVNYVGSFEDEVNFMKLHITLQLTPTFNLKEEAIVPYCLYRNYFYSTAESKVGGLRKEKKEKKTSSDEYVFVTEW